MAGIDPTGFTQLSTQPLIDGDDLINSVIPRHCLRPWRQSLLDFARDLKRDGEMSGYYTAMAQVRQLEYVMDEFGVSI